MTTLDPEQYLAGDTAHGAWRLESTYSGRSSEWANSVAGAWRAGPWLGSIAVSHRSGNELQNQGAIESLGTSRTALNPQDRASDDVLAKLVYYASPKNRLEITVQAYEGETETEAYSLRTGVDRSQLFGPGVTYRIDTQDFDAVDQRQRQRLSLEQSLRFDSTSVVDRIEWRAWYQRADTEQRTLEHRLTTQGGGPFGPLSSYETLRRASFQFEQDTVGAKAIATKTIEGDAASHLLTWGVSASFDRFDMVRDLLERHAATGEIVPDSLPHPTKYFPRSQVVSGGLFVQDEIELLEGRLRLVPGLRIDHFELTPDENDAVYLSGNPGVPTPVEMTADALSPRLGVVLQVSPGTSTFLQYAHGFRAPPYSAVNNGFTNVTFGYTTLPNPNLQPETSRNLELGLRGEGRQGEWRLALFHNTFEDFIEIATLGFDPRTGLLQFQPQNVAAAQIRGLELSGRLLLSPSWTLHAAASWIEGENEVTGLPLNSVAPPQLVTGVRWEPDASRWGAELMVTWADEKSVSDLDRSSFDQVAAPSYAVVDLLGQVRLTESLTLRFGAFNLFDETYWRWPNVLGVSTDSEVLDRFSSPGAHLATGLSWTP